MLTKVKGKKESKYVLYENKPLDEILSSIEEELIINAFNENAYNITRTAKKLGITRQNLQHKIKKYKIEIDQ